VALSQSRRHAMPGTSNQEKTNSDAKIVEFHRRAADQIRTELFDSNTVSFIISFNNFLFASFQAKLNLYSFVVVFFVFFF